MPGDHTVLQHRVIGGVYHPFGTDLMLRHEVASGVAGFVISEGSTRQDLGPERTQVHHDISRTAQPLIFPENSQDRNGRLWGDALHGTPRVPIKHDVSND
jgi:hypothetical protein